MFSDRPYLQTCELCQRLLLSPTGFCPVLATALVCPAAKTIIHVKSCKSDSCKAVQTFSELSELDRTSGPGAVLSAGGSHHATRRGRVGGGAVMRVVVVRWRAGEDGVSVGGGAAELEPPQVLGVDGLVALQHFDGLVYCEPFPLTSCRGRQRSAHESKHSNTAARDLPCSCTICVDSKHYNKDTRWILEINISHSNINGSNTRV